MEEQWVIFKEVHSILGKGGKIDNVYEVSNHGRVKKNGKIKSYKSKCGGHFKYGRYIVVGKGVYLHRLVAEHFVPNPHDKKFVNHIDGNKENNHASNLEWVTHQENIRHSVNTLGRKVNKTNTSYEWFLHKDGKFVSSFKSLSTLSKFLNRPRVTLSRIFEEDRTTKDGYKITRISKSSNEVNTKTTQLF
jgi:hypothetical protein